MSASPLQQLIFERIRDTGPLTFAEYMRMALYEPEYGYYVTGPAKMGWEGDYFTSTDVADFFAHCMGRQLQRMWEQLNHPATFRVLEQGAGRGDLAKSIQTWVTQHAPGLATALDYRIEDINAGMDALRSLSSNTTVPSANPDHTTDNFQPAVLLSNELVDAFPVHIVQKQENRLYEVFIHEQEGRLQEVLDHVSSDEIKHYLDEYKIPWHTFDDGWRAEINIDARHWMARSARLLLGNERRKHRGFLLAIDYGDLARQLYTPYRHQGTLSCYYQHQLTDRPLIRPGEQDITTHVNFTALITEGRKQGLHLSSFATQRQWLTDMGIYEELEQLRQSEFTASENDRASDRGQIALFQWYNLRQRVSTLTSPTGMGAFKVLIMKR
ncbi:MAG TPA: SAM-dependent methyltransferase [Dictyobacter sp.]|nr:SAM-dependent methyltransferase [Dictyobacter sp.]